MKKCFIKKLKGFYPTIYAFIFLLGIVTGITPVYAEITSGPISGVPTDLFQNPTSATPVFSLQGIWNGSTQLWNREAAATTNGLNGGASPAVMPYIWNGSSFDKIYEGINIGQALSDNSSNVSTIITTNTTTVVKGTGGILNTVVTSTAGTAWTAAFYNIGSTGCTGTPGSGYQFTLLITALGVTPTLNHTFPLGICVVTAGTTPGAFSVLSR